VEAGKILADMLAGRCGGGRPTEALHVNASAAATAASCVPVCVQQVGALLVAFEGHLHWRSAAALAAHQDNATALAELYRRHGSDCLKYVGGAFAIAILDTESSDALLAVDRMGTRSLSYANPPGGLVFGSSAESVAAHPRVGRRLIGQGIFNYLYFHVVPSPGTIYHGIRKLQPGECIVFRKGALERRFYWQLRYGDRSRQPVDSLKQRFHCLLREAVTRAAGGEAQLGAFLSGGTDSSTVAGLLTELRGEPAKTYSIGFAVEGFDEMQYARIAARHFGLSAHEYYLKPQDVADAIPVIAKAYDEPFGNASAVPTYFCARLARQDGVRVMLAGDGGDEIFGGNARYAWQKLFEAYRAIPAPLRRALLEPLAFGLASGNKIAPLRKLRSYIAQARVPLPGRLESYNFLQRSPLAEVFEADFLASVDIAEPILLHREAYERTASQSAVDRMMHLDLKFTLADNDLRKVSRMCEVAGLEARYPLLDDALVEFSGEIPASLKVKGMKLRYFFKQALKDFLPAETLAKPKHGFGLPFGVWLKEHGELADLAHESLAAFERRGILRPSYLKGLLTQHEAAHATYFGVMIWVIMMLEQWLAARKIS
jgi:asparagine synthase (glutamine-hydrolysing)